MFAGFDGASRTPGAQRRRRLCPFKPFEERAEAGRTEPQIMDDRRKARSPTSTRRWLFDRSAAGHPGHRLGRRLSHDRPGPRRPRLPGAGAGRLPADRQGQPDARTWPASITLFNTATPRIFADIDRAKADMLGVPPERVFEALQVYLGSAYVNDFNLLGRTYRVTAQADAPFRDDRSRHRQPEDPLELRARWCRSARSRPSRTRPARIA